MTPPAPHLDPVIIWHRSGQECRGVRCGEVIAYDMTILPRYRIAGGSAVDRCFLLLDEGVQLTQPSNWSPELAGGWYVDLVELSTDEQGRIVVRDLEVDILVPPSGRRYEVLDLDEFADAIEAGTLDPATSLRVLRQTQDFIARHLFDPGARPEDPWPDFPPRAIEPLRDVPIP